MIRCCALGVASEDSQVLWVPLHLATSPNFSGPGEEGTSMPLNG